MTSTDGVGVKHTRTRFATLAVFPLGMHGSRSWRISTVAMILHPTIRQALGWIVRLTSESVTAVDVIERIGRSSATSDGRTAWHGWCRPYATWSAIGAMPPWWP